ncbi:hypothetical protein GCM10022243_26940 [Saccharothrix violaceirubra]|uniref:Uncharacterized protein n=1 Tax=Saccharothrix violaceirubra TaxID=413306 RepID=A0A7W7TA64_9PSEU|nr:hypothetical protein [Saccharothrix violaceirubra]MBB4969383.1 hypothetical protein [Saccharothrix violaceirubra]
MYIDEPGGTEGELKVTVEDEEYTVEIGYDLDHDGVDESAVVELDDGGHVAFSDVDHDGDADVMTRFDRAGEVVGQARFDEESGEWISTKPAAEDEKTNTNAGKSIIVETEDGNRDVGPATKDTDGDGRADTAAVVDEDGDLWLFTDADGDGVADVATEFAADGEVTMSKHVDGGEWVEVEHGRLDEHGKIVPDTDDLASDVAWGTSGEQKVTVSGVVRIDSVTGQWISPN